MKDLGSMMRQAQEMQQKLADMQSQLRDKRIEGVAGGGMVKVVLNGKSEAHKVTLDPKVVDPNDITMLEDLMVAAFNDARGKIEKLVEEETRRIMGGIGLPPGVKLPF
jgi:DNA-binding YbaB/EbfC family protein